MTIPLLSFFFKCKLHYSFYSFELFHLNFPKEKKEVAAQETSNSEIIFQDMRCMGHRCR